MKTKRPHSTLADWSLISVPKDGELFLTQEAYQDPIAQQYDPVAFSFKQGRIAAIAHTKGVDKHELRHASENTDYLDNLLEKEQVFKDK